MDQEGSEENHKLNEFPNLDSFVIHTCVITVACSPVMHSIDFNWTFQAVQPLACKNWIQWEQWGFVYVQGTRRSSQNESLFGESKAITSMIELSCHLVWRRGSKSVARKVYCSIHVITCLCCMHICLHHSCLWLKSFLGTDFGASWPCLRSYSTRWCQRASEWWTGSEDFGGIVVCAMSIHSIAFEGWPTAVVLHDL